MARVFSYMHTRFLDTSHILCQKPCNSLALGDSATPDGLGTEDEGLIDSMVALDPPMESIQMVILEIEHGCHNTMQLTSCAPASLCVL